ncbi:MAG TPA: aminotransferase class III-fold pyridoxal phosphate-dependent enzyme [Candidatus Polarisedimenticolia bacterium]|nr:aminotransferase class III-fold pyridoxal phosphate-dependent enzyme [Candidatus Polarisedimenticolia bacterium]
MKLPIEHDLSREEQEAIAAEGIDNWNTYLRRFPKLKDRDRDRRLVEWSGEGSIIRNIYGEEYVDCLGGYGIFSLGHRHPEVVRAVKSQLDRMPLHSQYLVNPITAEAGRRLAEVSPGNLKRTFFCNSGTEAIEGALKTARLHTKKSHFISTRNSFHGKSLGSLSVTGRDVFREPFQPLLQDVVFVPYGDAAAVERAMTPRTAAVILEPVQGEGGVIIPPDDYLPKVREACTRRGVLLIADEVQTGLGRTGALFGVNHWNVVPDIMCLAKALSGGVIPCGAFTTTDEIYAAFHVNPMYHSSTFGNNPLAATAASMAIEITVRDRLSERSARLGSDLLRRLEEMQARHPEAIREVRGKGLLIGIEMHSESLGAALAERLYGRRILVAYALNKPEVIRIEPPLNIPEPLLDRLVEALDESLVALQS